MLFGFLIGVAIIILGIWVTVHTKRMNRGKRIDAVVVNWEPSSMEILGQSLPCAEVTLEIPTSYGVQYKNMKLDMLRGASDTVEVYYDEKRDKLDLAENVRTNSGKGPYMLIGFGVIWCMIFVLAYLMTTNTSAGEIAKYVMIYGMSLLFIAVGVGLVIVQPVKRKRELERSRMVEGTLVEYITKHGRGKEMDVHCPVYEYYYNGEFKRLKSNVAGSSDKYRQIGRKVTIVINEATGNVYCKEDQGSGVIMGIVFAVFGVIIALACTFCA